LSGFVERVIEDWLTSSDERSYQLSFVSLLRRSGHKIKYVSKHSTLEFGKDVVSLSPDGELTAYQLKVGNISLATWRQIREEVYELSEVSLRSPSGRRTMADKCFLVTTGVVDDTVHEQLRDKNVAFREKGLPEIDTIELPDLIRQFTEVFDEFFPVSIGSFNDLMRIFLSEGTGPVDKELLSSVLLRLDPVESSKKKVSRAFSNLVVAAEFASTPFRRANNHISVIDVWVLAACRIMSIAMHQAIKSNWWLPWLELCKEAIAASGSELLADVCARENFVEGDPLVDMLAVGYRKAVALGYAAAVINANRIDGAELDSRPLLEVTLKQVPLGVWGEACWNYYLNLALALSSFPDGEKVSLGLVISWLETLCGKEYVEPPYWGIEEALSIRTFENPSKHRLKAFYSLGSAMDFISRRMWRRNLASLWPQLSKRELAELVPDEPEAHFDWTIEEATLEIHRLPMRASWQEIRKSAFSQRSKLFPTGADWLLPYMLCTIPHRITRGLSGELDYLTSPPAAKRDWLT
jgi:hypothetical protein